MKQQLKFGADPAIVTYFEDVRRHLHGVSSADREELLATLAERLEELEPEQNPREFLGDPAECARLMREAAGLPPERRRRLGFLRSLRMRTKVLIVVAILLVALLVSGTVWATHYQPLSIAGTVGTSGVPVNPAPFNVEYYQYKERSIVFVGYGVTNHGRFDADIDGATLDHGAPLEIIDMRATADPALQGGQWQQAPRRAHPVVHPGKTLMIYIIMKMVPYSIPAGGYTEINSPTLHFKVLGVHHAIRDVRSIGVLGPGSTTGPQP